MNMAENAKVKRLCPFKRKKTCSTPLAVFSPICSESHGKNSIVSALEKQHVLFKHKVYQMNVISHQEWK